jgi:hypothetical protein
MAAALRLGQPLQQDDAHALGPAGAVGVGGEGPAAAVRRQRALPGEADEEPRRAHDPGTAGQGQLTLAAAQGVRREVDGDQGGRARGVDGQGRAFEAERVRDAAGRDTGGHPGGQEALRTGRDNVAVGVPQACQTGEHTDRRAL